MSLTRFDDLDQGSPEWLEARRGIVTASVVGQLITQRNLTAVDFACGECGANPSQPCRGKKDPSAPIQAMHRARTAAAKNNHTPKIVTARGDDVRSLTAQLAAERIAGWTDSGFYNADMARGHFDEPFAVEAYEQHYRVRVEPCGFMVRDDWGYKIGLSPDGLVGEDGLIEIKSRRMKRHVQTVIGDGVPAENMAQVQAALLVSGRAWCDYVSFSGGLALYPIRVAPDPKWQDAIVTAVSEFEKAVGVMVAKYEARTLGLPQTERVAYDVDVVI